MKYNPEIHHRRSIRLKGYDYSQEGLYFLTICTQNREHIFGTIENEEMLLNEYGNITRDYWNDIPTHYNNVELDEYIIMPNHLHGIVRFNIPVGVQFIASDNGITSSNQIINQPKQGAINRTPTVGNVVRAFKARCTHAINKFNETIGVSIWQRNYYEHIIRNEESYHQISEYINYNPMNWKDDKY